MSYIRWSKFPAEVYYIVVIMESRSGNMVISVFVFHQLQIILSAFHRLSDMCQLYYFSLFLSLLGYHHLSNNCYHLKQVFSAEFAPFIHVLFEERDWDSNSWN